MTRCRPAALALFAALTAYVVWAQIKIIPDTTRLGNIQVIPSGASGATGATGGTFTQLIWGLSGTQTPRNNISIYAGELIFTNAIFRVTQLGRPCLNSNNQTHALYLMNQTATTSLATVTVNMAGCTPGLWVFAPITPVTLNFNAFYICYSGETNGGDYFYDDPMIPLVNEAAAVSQSAYANNAPPATPPSGANNNTAGHAYVPCNIGYQPYSWMTATPSGATLSNSGTYRGARFTMAATKTVNQLGRPCSTGNSQTHDLWLMDTTGTTSLAHTTVNMSGCVAGTHEWSPVSTVTLNAGTSYLLLSGETIGGDTWYNDSATFSPDATVATLVTSIVAGNGGPATQPIGPYTAVTAGSAFIGASFGY